MAPHRGLWHGIATGTALVVFVILAAAQLVLPAVPGGRLHGLVLGFVGLVLGLLLGGKVREE